MANRLVAWAIIATAGACVAPLASAEAFWAARGPRGGVAFGGPAAGAFIRPPVVAGHYYAGGCL
ncbi:MAG: hypothetical protein K2Y29_06960, partial [Beijerinckiaceae bacterium]|nr:hypothetical protein [Beijerinckiaceae bacterium]